MYIILLHVHSYICTCQMCIIMCIKCKLLYPGDVPVPRKCSDFRFKFSKKKNYTDIRVFSTYYIKYIYHRYMCVHMYVHVCWVH